MWGHCRRVKGSIVRIPVPGKPGWLTNNTGLDRITNYFKLIIFTSCGRVDEHEDPSWDHRKQRTGRPKRTPPTLKFLPQFAAWPPFERAYRKEMYSGRVYGRWHDANIVLVSIISLLWRTRALLRGRPIISQ